jgi:hypothetical protein
MFDDSMDNSDGSIVQGVAPFITIDDLVDVVFQTESNTWDFLRQGESLRIYGTVEGLSVLFLTERDYIKENWYEIYWSYVWTSETTHIQEKP